MLNIANIPLFLPLFLRSLGVSAEMKIEEPLDDGTRTRFLSVAFVITDEVLKKCKKMGK